MIFRAIAYSVAVDCRECITNDLAEGHLYLAIRRVSTDTV
jgi:hypothetical protein